MQKESGVIRLGDGGGQERKMSQLATVYCADKKVDASFSTVAHTHRQAG